MLNHLGSYNHLNLIIFQTIVITIIEIHPPLLYLAINHYLNSFINKFLSVLLCLFIVVIF
jgi:hypothetical protein